MAERTTKMSVNQWGDPTADFGKVDSGSNIHLAGSQNAAVSDNSNLTESTEDKDSLGNETVDTADVELSSSSDFILQGDRVSIGLDAAAAAHPVADVLTIFDDEIDELTSLQEEDHRSFCDHHHHHNVIYGGGGILCSDENTTPLDGVECDKDPTRVGYVFNDSIVNSFFYTKPERLCEETGQPMRDSSNEEPCGSEEQRPPSRCGLLTAFLMDTNGRKARNGVVRLNNASSPSCLPNQAAQYTDPSIGILGGTASFQERPTSSRGTYTMPLPEIQEDITRAPLLSYGHLPSSTLLDSLHFDAKEETSRGINRPEVGSKVEQENPIEQDSFFGEIENAKKWDTAFNSKEALLLDQTFFSATYSYVKNKSDQLEEGSDSVIPYENYDATTISIILKVFYFHPSSVFGGDDKIGTISGTSSSVSLHTERSIILKCLQCFVESTMLRQQQFIDAELMRDYLGSSHAEVGQDNTQTSGKKSKSLFPCLGYRKLHLDSTCRVIAELDDAKFLVSLSDMVAFSSNMLDMGTVISVVFTIASSIKLFFQAGLAHGALHGGNVMFDAGNGCCMLKNPLGVLSNIFSPMDTSFLSPRQAILCDALLDVTRETTARDRKRAQSTKVGEHQLSYKDEAMLYLLNSLQQSRLSCHSSNSTMEKQSLSCAHLGTPQSSDDIYALGTLCLFLFFGIPLGFGLSVRETTSALLQILEKVKTASVCHMLSWGDRKTLIKKIILDYFFDSSLCGSYAQRKFVEGKWEGPLFAQFRDFTAECLMAGFVSALGTEELEKDVMSPVDLESHPLFTIICKEYNNLVTLDKTGLVSQLHPVAYRTYFRIQFSRKYRDRIDAGCSPCESRHFPYFIRYHRNCIFALKQKAFLNDRNDTFLTEEEEEQLEEVRPRSGKNFIKKEWYEFNPLDTPKTVFPHGQREDDTRRKKYIECLSAFSSSCREAKELCQFYDKDLLCAMSYGDVWCARETSSQVSLRIEKQDVERVSSKPAGNSEEGNRDSKSQSSFSDLQGGSSLRNLSCELQGMYHHEACNFVLLADLSGSRITLDVSTFKKHFLRATYPQEKASLPNKSEVILNNPLFSLPPSSSAPLSSPIGLIFYNIASSRIELTHSVPFIILNHIHNSEVLLPPCHLLLIVNIENTIVHGAATYILVQKKTVKNSQLHISCVELEAVSLSKSSESDHLKLNDAAVASPSTDVLRLSYPYNFVFPGVSLLFFRLKIPLFEHEKGGNFGLISDLWRERERESRLVLTRENLQGESERTQGVLATSPQCSTLHDRAVGESEIQNHKRNVSFSMEHSVEFALSQVNGEFGPLEYPYSYSHRELENVFEHTDDFFYDLYLLNDELGTKEIYINSINADVEADQCEEFPFICFFSMLDSVEIKDCHCCTVLICGATDLVKISSCENMRILCLARNVQVINCKFLNVHVFAVDSCHILGSSHINVVPFYLACPAFSIVLRNIIESIAPAEGSPLKTAVESFDLEKSNVLFQEEGVCIDYFSVDVDIFSRMNDETVDNHTHLLPLIFIPCSVENFGTQMSEETSGEQDSFSANCGFFEAYANSLNKTLTECFSLVSLSDLICCKGGKSIKPFNPDSCCHSSFPSTSPEHHRLHDLFNPSILRLPLSFHLRHPIFSSSSDYFDFTKMGERKKMGNHPDTLWNVKCADCCWEDPSLLVIDSLLIERVCLGKIHIVQSVKKMIIRDCDGPLEIAVCAAAEVELIDCSHITLRVACQTFTAKRCFHCHISLHVNEIPLYISCGSMETSPFNMSAVFMDKMLEQVNVRPLVNKFSESSTQSPSPLQSLLAGEETPNDGSLLPKIKSSHSDYVLQKRLQQLFETVMITPPLPHLCIGEFAPLLECFSETLKREEENERASAGEQWAALLYEVLMKVSQEYANSLISSLDGTGMVPPLESKQTRRDEGDFSLPQRAYLPPPSPPRPNSHEEDSLEVKEQIREANDKKPQEEIAVENQRLSAPQDCSTSSTTFQVVVKTSMRVGEDEFSTETDEESSSRSSTTGTNMNSRSSRPTGRHQGQGGSHDASFLHRCAMDEVPWEGEHSSSPNDSWNTESGVKEWIPPPPQSEGDEANASGKQEAWRCHDSSVNGFHHRPHQVISPEWSDHNDDDESSSHRPDSPTSILSCASLVPTSASGLSRSSRTGLLPPPLLSDSSEDTLSEEEEEQDLTAHARFRCNRSPLAAKYNSVPCTTQHNELEKTNKDRGEHKSVRLKGREPLSYPHTVGLGPSIGKKSMENAMDRLSLVLPHQLMQSTIEELPYVERNTKKKLCDLLSLVEDARRCYYADREPSKADPDKAEADHRDPKKDVLQERVVAALAKLREMNEKRNEGKGSF